MQINLARTVLNDQNSKSNKIRRFQMVTHQNLFAFSIRYNCKFKKSHENDPYNTRLNQIHVKNAQTNSYFKKELERCNRFIRNAMLLHC